MQFGAPYIGRSFALKRRVHVDESFSIPEGTVGKLKALAEPEAKMLLVFPQTDPMRGKGLGTEFQAWIPEDNVTYVEETKTEESPALLSAPAETGTSSVTPGLMKAYREGLHEVKSSNIKAIGYFDPQGEDWLINEKDGGDLVVEFKNGTMYRYAGVLRRYFEEMLTSDSVGVYLNKVIKDPKLGLVAQKLEA